MKNKRLMALVLTAAVVTSNASTVVMAETVNDSNTTVSTTTQTPFNYRHENIVGPTNLTDITEVDNIKNLEEGTIIVKFDTSAITLQSLFSVSNSGAANDHFHLYVGNNRIGCEVRRSSGTVYNEHFYRDITLKDAYNIVAFRAEKKASDPTKTIYTAYVNGVKLFVEESSVSTFIKGLLNTTTASIGRTVRSSNTNAYPFSGTIEYAEIYSNKLTDSEMQDLTTFGLKGPSNLSYVVNENKDYIINWTRSTDETVTGYKIYKDGIVIATIDGRDTTSYNAGNLIGYNDFKISSFDSTGVESEVKAPLLIEINKVAQSQMRATATSAEANNATEGAASYAIDGRSNTWWHTQWTGGNPGLPQSITLNLGGKYSLEQFTYLPRTGGGNGNISSYDIQVSTDGANFKTVKSGTWNADAKLKYVNFDTPVEASYIRLVAKAGAGGYASAAEINVFGPQYVEVAPTKPAVTVSNLTENKATLTWTTPANSSEAIDKYIVSNGTNDIEEILATEISEDGSYSYEITGLTPGTEYNSYKVKAVGANGLVSEAATVSFTTVAVNKSDLQALVGTVGNLNPSDYTAESWQVLESALTAANNVLSSETATQLEVDVAKENLQVAISSLQAVPVEVAPSAPVDLQATNVKETSAKLTWSTPANSPEEIVRYVISYGDDGVNVKVNESGSYYYEITGLTPATEYSYTVKAVGANGKESTVTAVNFTTLENTNGINGVTAPTEVKRFDTAQFKLNLGSDVNKVKVIYYWYENGIKNTYEEYYTVGTTGSLTVDRKLRFAREYQVEFIPMVNGNLQKDEAKKVDLNVVENKVGDIFGDITGNGDTESTNIQKVGDSVQFTIETALNVDKIQFNFITSNNYIEYYNKATNAKEVDGKLVWTINRPLRTYIPTHQLVISAMNEGYVMASSNFEINILNK